jgi:hypothetical protein
MFKLFILEIPIEFFVKKIFWYTRTYDKTKNYSTEPHKNIILITH